VHVHVAPSCIESISVSAKLSEINRQVGNAGGCL
jgi:hypothetical protein